MKMKQYRRYRMDFTGSWLSAFCILCGLAFFLRIEYYFMFTNPADCGAAEVIFSMILPLLLSGAALVILKFLKLNAPGIIGIIGALMCAALLICTFLSGNVMNIILSVLLFSAGAALLLSTVGGYVPTRQFSVILFSLIFLIRILFFSPGLNLLAWVLTGSDLCMIGALAVMPLAMKPGKMKRH